MLIHSVLERLHDLSGKASEWMWNTALGFSSVLFEESPCVMLEQLCDIFRSLTELHKHCSVTEITAGQKKGKDKPTQLTKVGIAHIIQSQEDAARLTAVVVYLLVVFSEYILLRCVAAGSGHFKSP